MRKVFIFLLTMCLFFCTGCDSSVEGYTQQNYDIDKTSGILRSMGMSKEEFEASCLPLCNIDSWTYSILNQNSDELPLLTQQLLEYPSEYVGKCFTLYHYWKYQSKKEPMAMKITGKGTSKDGYITYSYEPDYNSLDSEEHILLFDVRDDTYAPTISVGDKIYPYMIFNGVQTLNGTDYLCFDLVSVKK